ncbi:XRE family transcriptional regulator [Mesorhizobium sp. M3A.F.Ca.ET.174.01.1.1]|uniref:helix-turn-helix domain-containing protein n=1 Tax=unclassified Mesorhizobium TaxID=325217 RepID=UPI001093D359|nr:MULTISPECIES: helix-turn-helix transcriptional regulator [unclassified Mesorhizobium]TGS82742.1 XRE family transcriptional regulator [Mesorhizobium sp. M3A.F.Ca.ET.175.01.1.1]TGT22697.1 XRE family transcriptional regulator [Mesorhizobium sp. M3A.F.Ca.ET.174.01.1.1]
MEDLRKRFGRLVMAHRKRAGYTQEQLAERAGVSIDTISKIEVGATGARFPMIERIAEALQVDPAELFSPEIPTGALRRGPLVELTTRLAGLSANELRWISGVVEAALRNKS